MYPLTGPHQIHLSRSVPTLLPHLSPKDLSAFSTTTDICQLIFFSPLNLLRKKKMKWVQQFSYFRKLDFSPSLFHTNIASVFFLVEKTNPHRIHILRFDPETVPFSKHKAGPSLHCPALGKGSGISGQRQWLHSAGHWEVTFCQGWQDLSQIYGCEGL